MKKTHLITSITALALLGACIDNNEVLLHEGGPADLVNPFIGTDYTGNTYPGAQAPFGMVQLSPDNGTGGWDRIAGYFYPDSTIAGFSHTHLSGTGAGDLYDISFMPVMLPPLTAPGELGIHSRFSHDKESARAGYYSVTLTDYNINVELTATARCGIQRYTFPGGAAAILLNLDKAMNWDRTTDSEVVATDSVTIEGFRFSDGWARDERLWFCSRFSQPWDSLRIVTRPITDTSGDTIGSGKIAWFYFNTSPGERITISTALSATGAEGARLNLATEVPTDNFDYYRRQATAEWNKLLTRIEIDTTGAIPGTDPSTFYTALYRSMLAPTLYDDTDGRYRGPDGNIHTNTPGHANYGTFSLWDTYRAAHPLYTLIAPGQASDMAMSLLRFGEQNGRLPVWNMHASETDMMIGYHSAPVIIDALLKGLLPDSLTHRALDLAVATARLDDYREIGLYRKLGYVPYDLAGSPNNDGTGWSLSKTLEYAYDDYTIARLAEAAGDTAIAHEFRQRSRNYLNLFNPATGFFQPRDDQGNWQPEFDPAVYSPHICESNAWHYLWSVQQDPDALIDLLGGKEATIERLQQMLTAKIDSAALPIFSTGMIGEYAHGNEPSHHVLYMFNRAGRSDLAAHYLAQVMDNFYNNTPAGLCGNEDCGQMSAWYVFSALGFYPLDPLSGEYELGTPLYRRTTLHLPSGKKFTIEAPELSADRRTIAKASLNGKLLPRRTITYEQILAGGTLHLDME